MRCLPQGSPRGRMQLPKSSGRATIPRPMAAARAMHNQNHQHGHSAGRLGRPEVRASRTPEPEAQGASCRAQVASGPLGPGLTSMLHAQRWRAQLHSLRQPQAAAVAAATVNAQQQQQQRSDERSWADRLASLYRQSGTDSAHSASSGSPAEETDAHSPASAGARQALHAPSTAAQQQLQKQMEVLPEAIEQGESDDGYLRLGSGGFAALHCVGLSSSLMSHTTASSPSSSLFLLGRPSTHRSADGGDSDQDLRSQEPARARLSMQDRGAAAILWSTATPWRMGPPQLVAVTHGSACVRGRHKPDMQDHHLMVQGMLELAVRTSSPSASTAAAALGHQQQQQQLVVEGDEWDDTDAAPVCLRQSLRRHATYGAAVQQQRQRPVLCSSSLTGVFDGHCGHHTSRYAARRLPVLLAHSTQLWAALEGAAHPEGLSGAALSLAAGALHEAIARLDSEILDEDRHKPPGEFDGSTALLGLQVGTHLLLANLGDSRAVLSRGGEALRLTTDHTPNLPEERKRIEACGGYVREHRGVWRVVLPLGPGCGLKISAVSRALGDVDFKEPRRLISSVPDVFHCALQPHLDRFAIFASDGVWSVMSDEQAVDCVEAALVSAESEGHAPHRCAELAAQALRSSAQNRGSGDDITAVVTVFEWEPLASVEGEASCGKGGEGSSACN